MATLRKKSDDTYGIYIAELSMGELKAIQTALADKHDGPVADELFCALGFYLDRVPEPGQTKKEAEVELEKVETGRADSILPEPPSVEAGGPAPSGEAPAPEEPEEPAGSKPSTYDDLVKGGADAALPEPPSIPAE